MSEEEMRAAWRKFCIKRDEGVHELRPDPDDEEPFLIAGEMQIPPIRVAFFAGWRARDE